MDDKKYLVAISHENNKIQGSFSGDGFAVEFNPLTVLGDLLDTVFGYEKVDEEWEIANYFFKDTYQRHPFFQDKEHQREIGTYNHKRKTGENVQYGNPFYSMWVDINSFIAAVMGLRECFEQGKNIPLNEFELIKALNQFKFTFEIQERYENLHYRHGGSLYKEYEEKGELDILEKLGRDTESEFQYVSVYFGTGVTARRFQEYLENEKRLIRFAYTCYSLEESLFAVWHYLIFHDYIKFNKCHHCGGYFATKTLKQDYCNRNSPYAGYEHLECGPAAKDIRQELRREVDRIDSMLRYRDDLRTTAEHRATESFAFLEQCNEYRARIKKCSSVENLKAFEGFLVRCRAGL